MAKHKFQQTLARLLREIVQLFKTLTGQFVRWFLRNILVTRRWQQGQAAGFVLPTIAFMLMVVALVVAAILFRTFNRTDQLIRENQQQAIVNAASPAIDRAKSKIEALFTSNPTPDIPSEESLENRLLNENEFTFADEVLVDNLPGVSAAGLTKTTAWKFQDQSKNVTIIYAILARAERDNISIDPDPLKKDIYESDVEKRAKAFIVRNGPLNVRSGNVSSKCPVPEVTGNLSGWFNKGSSTSSVYKNFQVYAIAIPTALTEGKPTTNTGIATIEYQQDRAFDRANKWGAWFRTDIEIAPGPRFNWNGAMHSQGNIVVRSQDGFKSYMISSESSCVYRPLENSAITLRADEEGPGGQFITGKIRDGSFNPDRVWIHTDPDVETPNNINPISLLNPPTKPTDSSKSQDSIKDPSKPQMNVASNPLLLYTRGVSEARLPENTSYWEQDKDFWTSSPLIEQQRVSQKNSCAPYVDDTYRADNRYGPKPSYNKEDTSTETKKCEAKPYLEEYGSPIKNTPNNASLRRDNSPGATEGENVGLDGYWERRARFNGLRVIVGQRLELGNPFGWNVDLDDDNTPAKNNNILNDPDKADRTLYPPDDKHTAPTLLNGSAPDSKPRINEGRQYTTLRDNLAAVQATAVYHHTYENGNFPITFVATTAHPGTAKTIQDSITFSKPQTENNFQTQTLGKFGDGTNEILTNFFIGEGTNGWEFNVVPGSTQSEDVFITALNNTTNPLRIALNNLAHFAGDPEGYFPPKQETGLVHPYPKLTMWGNFSNLRETLNLMEKGTTYDDLSIADKTNLHTAAGTLGMLAYNISYLQEFKYSDTENQKLLNRLDKRLAELSNHSPQTYFNSSGATATTDESSANYKKDGEVEVVTGTPAQLEIHYDNSNVSSPAQLKVAIPGIDKPAPPEAFIAGMELLAAKASPPNIEADLELAKLLHLKEQMERDRKFGFRSMPTNGNAINDATPDNNYKYKVTYVTDFKYAGVTYDKTAGSGKVDTINLGCDISDPSVAARGGRGNNYFGFGKPDDSDEDKAKAEEQRFIRLATSLCPTQPKFPSLYYLFPVYNHDHEGDAVAVTNYPKGGPATTATTDYLQPGNPLIPTPDQPPVEPYVATSYTEPEPYIATDAVNKKYFYQIVSSDPDDFSDIALLPRTKANATCKNNEWCLPTGAAAGAANSIIDKVSAPNTTSANASVAFQDKGIFDGREMMNVRLLDIDLELLRKSPARDGGGKQDVWLPTSGLVYAFREDAVREDAIARPALTNSWKTYEDDWKVSSRPGDPGTTNRMDVWAPKDPPLCDIQADGDGYKCSDTSPSRGISPKPVDYYADPDRRPYGFRLKNGLKLIRDRWDAGDRKNNLRGLSLISDNPVYIQGDFNVHIPPKDSFNPKSPSNVLEEFKAKIADVDIKSGSVTDAKGPFYERFYTDRNNQDDLNTEKFAKLGEDGWRPAEIIADAVGILSSNFCDGTIQGGIRNQNTGCGSSKSSYQNSHFKGDPTNVFPTAAQDPGYVCENPFDIRSVKLDSVEVAGSTRKGCDGPVKVFRNGEIKYNQTTANNFQIYNEYLNFTDARKINFPAGPNWVNAAIISGIVPSRTGQSNGGLVNFPRFLEGWDTKAYPTDDKTSLPLRFSGAMIQLNFSNYATAPWDQDAWEPSQNALSGGGTSSERIRYYSAPLRTWGYDVALQYAPAGPVARRMVNPAENRSELYREPAADDPYICKLRAAIDYPCS